ncbi:phosphoribosylformylglycinamidine cyclo-ligase [Acetivibrio straminisolvens JCM 21531]|uniref:phosphoribosylformylglycinamidine cyclo-ligase n=1 Tax=Acetivibrio straminisolvens JCM 21531 TaxID=1294263 RepID=W4V981_9FIRM|nr:phosphoribosylformylglycinamidine cyclo-ligase [Acetivibrio straminisolvens JCM 21531]
MYVKTILDLKEKFELKGISHITGGGFIENIPRMLPQGLGVKIFKGTWPVLPIFTLLKDLGNLDEMDMYNTFNMGIGMTIAVDAEIANSVLEYLNKDKEQAYIIGEIVSDKAGLEIC